jgi:superfamily II DNA or RNA helicase
MPRIFDNIEAHLLPALRETIEVAYRSDFCVGYFNLRGWRSIDSQIESFTGGEGRCCRLLIGMQRLPDEELREALSLARKDGEVDLQTAARLKRRVAQEFRDQLVWGLPTDEDEQGLRRLCAQIKTKKVVVKLFLRHPLHAKLYLLSRNDPVNPMVGFLGSSNLTIAGLSKQGELNVDILDHDACVKLQRWFDDRWNDKFCVDISEDLVKVIEESWARVVVPPPHHIYVKIAYHLSNEARKGISEFRIPSDLPDRLFEFQKAAVKIAAHHLNQRGGVLIGDVVGLGKTIMASALARIFEDDHGFETLIICPKNLIPMWEDHRLRYRMRAKVISITNVQNDLPSLPRHRLVLIDESHNLRNREGQRYRAILEYIQNNDSKLILLSATPYNKTYLDLSNQLRLFVPEDKDIGVRPERLLRDMGEIEFQRQHQCSPRTLRAFEQSSFADDWRDLMRLYLVRRTRSFIRDNYARADERNGRKYLEFEDGTRQYFPDRVPKTVRFRIDEGRVDDQYARLFSDQVVDAIGGLALPRYGLGNYIKAAPAREPTSQEATIIRDLSRAGGRLRGFCRTNLFKRLESGGYSFLLSVARHVLRNFVNLHALEHSEPVPVGTQDAALLDTRTTDVDVDLFDTDDDNGTNDTNALNSFVSLRSEEDFRKAASETYTAYSRKMKGRFRWLRADLFDKSLAESLLKDARALIKVLKLAGDWDPHKDEKLKTLLKLLDRRHPDDKVIVFTQFADTVEYLEHQLAGAGISKLAGVTGDSQNPTQIAWRFSPASNQKRNQITPNDELRVVVATDVLSEGQNLQDCSIVVNYDLPWAIIRLVQRAGRIDRIGQQAERLLCYSFLPADGVERIINLRNRVKQRLRENAEVIGTDEQFFDDERDDVPLVDLYNEKAGIYDAEEDTEVDLASYAYQIWKNAIDQNPELERIVPAIPNVVYSTRAFEPAPEHPDGVLVFVRTGKDTDALAWMDEDGKSVTESQFAILKAAECTPETPAVPRRVDHHVLVRKAVELITAEEAKVGGSLGSPRGARFKAYERLSRYLNSVAGTLFDTLELRRAIEEIYRYPLFQYATDLLNRQLKSGISDPDLVRLVLALRDDGRLCNVAQHGTDTDQPQIICSMGLRRPV